MQEKYARYSLIGLILALGVLIVTTLWPFVNGLLAAFTLYVLVRRQMVFLTERCRLPRPLGALLILLEIAAVIIVPVYFTALMLVEQVQTINMDLSGLIEVVTSLETVIQERFGYDVLSTENLTTATSYATRALQMLVGQVSGFAVTAAVMVFLLYFMLVSYRETERYVYELMPFRGRNRTDVLTEIHRMVRSNAIGIPLLAIIQGGVAYVGYLMFGVPSALLFALVTAFATIIPIVGTGIVWLPLAIYLGLNGDWMAALGLAAFCGLLLTNVDNVIRLVLQKRLADTHPLITVFGVVLGLGLFGFWGIIFGPLVLSLFFLLVDIFKREYLDN